jgi:hypothetical protein
LELCGIEERERGAETRARAQGYGAKSRDPDSSRENAFLSSIGCINPCASLPNANEIIEYEGSRERVIAIIEDLKAFLGADFPKKNGKKIPRAFVVIDGEPAA